MTEKVKAKVKRFSAFVLAVMLIFSSVPYREMAYAAGEQDISWTQDALIAAAVKNYTPTGLSYRTSSSGIKAPYAAFGEKQYLYGSGQYSEYADRLIYCVNMHESNGGTLLWNSQAFLGKKYDRYHLPTEYINGSDNEEIRLFNFLMIVYATSYQAKQEPNSLHGGNANVGVDVLTVCVQLAQGAADYTVFTGKWEEDFAWFKSVAYPRALDAVGPTNAAGDATTYKQLTSTNIPQWAKDKGCKDRAQAIFCYVWTAADLTRRLDVEGDLDIWRQEAVLEEDGLYHVRIPFDGDNQAIVEYLRILNAECYGDWQRIDDVSSIHLVSPTGAMPSEGSIAKFTYADSDGMIAKSIAQAELSEIKFYCENNRGERSFDNVQTYFTSIMEDPLEIYLRLGGPPPNTATNIEVDRFEHEETWRADYNVNLIKYDSETGKPLEGAHFDILEAFDDSQLDSTSLDLENASGGTTIGSLNSTSWGDDDISSNYSGDIGLLQTDDLLYNWANDSGSQFERWNDPDNDPCRQDDNVTDANGRLTYRDGTGQSSGKEAHYDVRDYSYHKGYCNGHPAPVIQYEEPEDEEEGGTKKVRKAGEDEGEDDGEDVDAYNQAIHDEAWAAWYVEVETCGELANDGGFFHAIEPDIAREAVEADRDQFYEDFISLTYDYSAKEIASRKGYILHDLHGDDVEIEWRTVTSSQYKDFTKSGIRKKSGTNQGLKISPVAGNESSISKIENDAATPFSEEPEPLTILEEPEKQAGQQVRQAPPGLIPEAEPEKPKVKALSFEFIDESGFKEETEEDVKKETKSSLKTRQATASDAEEASPSEIKKASPAEAGKPNLSEATPSELIKRKRSFTGFMTQQFEDKGFPKVTNSPSSRAASVRAARDSITFKLSEVNPVDQGQDTIVDWTFILYDHRTEGEVHINKKDLDLIGGENAGYSAYGDSQGDGSIEGAVYGLFAASDILHPDGKSGVIFKKDNLVSVATTDKNGDASFLAITEAPGTIFNYQTGKMEQTGFTASGNLHTDKTKADSIRDNESFTGHTPNGDSLSLTDSKAGNAAWYQKLTSNQGVDGTGDNSAGYPIQNNEGNNGNNWIGRPLIISQEGSRYYVMELTRSEGYELSRYGVDAEVTNRGADAAGTFPSAEGTVFLSELLQNRPGQYNQFTSTSRDTANGYDIIVSGLMDGAAFYTTKTENLVNPNGTHTELVPVQEPVYGTPGTRIIIDGKAIEASVGDRITLPNGTTATVNRVSSSALLKTGIRPGNAFQVEVPVIAGEDKVAVEADFIKKVNEGLKKAGYKKTEESSPWLKIPLAGTTEKTWCESINKTLKKYQVFNAFSLEEVVTEGGTRYALLRYSYLQAQTALSSLYDETNKSIWVKKPITYTIKGKTVNGYLYCEYPDGTYEDVVKNAAGFVTSATIKQQSLSKNAAVWGEDLALITLVDETGKNYWVYDNAEQAYDNNGNPVYNTRYDSIEVAPGYEIKVTDTPLNAVYNAGNNIYTVHIDPSIIPADGKLDIRIKYTEEYVNGTSQPYTQYVQANAIISALPTATAHASYIKDILLTYPGSKTLYQDGGTRTKPLQVMERVIRQKVKIVKDIQTMPDGTYAHNTNTDSGHEDSFTTGPGEKEDAAAKLPNFRFKIYLKSNLERLYRDSDGAVTWLDRDGKIVDVEKYQESYPEKEPFGSVQKLYTKVPHKPDSKTTGSINNNTWDSAVTVNKSLYSFKPDGLIEENQNPGYTRLLETVTRTMEDGAGKTRQVEQYNYEKFFDAVKTANHDKWDQQEDKSTSFKPFSYIRELIFGTGKGEREDPPDHNNGKIENTANTSEIAKDNALRSDAVRQFAITWYLDEEVKKLQEENGYGESQPAGGSESYQNELYDRALQRAIQKTENYLKPFFIYDLDEIYSIDWDSEPDGGKDKDRTTLSADTLYDITGNGAETSKDGYYYGISKYLPYGAYVAVEQQPFNKELGDLYNKHYKTDRPKEIILPSVYEPGGNVGSPEVFNEEYEYKSTDTPEDLQKKYHIRFNEEWAENHTDDLRKYVIRAHNADGDFEIYKYGLEPDKLTGTIAYPGGTYPYNGFTISQGEFDPYKDIYEAEHAANDYKSNQKVEKYYHYGSLSEKSGLAGNVLYQHGPNKDDNNPSGMYFKDNVKTMTGALTAYDGLYAAALVPWTVTAPADAGSYEPGAFIGYADGKYRNTFYTTKLRIEKLDSETGENILHDGAVFALYSAGRDDAETSDGLVKFYNQDTVITGSKEFLEAMGARTITPVAKAAPPWGTPYLGKYYGTVSAGTPICRESEQIIMRDALGEKTGEFKAFTTTNDVSMRNGENQNQTVFSDQNVGYLTTPQPLGAGCYVLAEIKAPTGYVKSKPVAIEIYSDQVSYYLDGNRDNRVAAAVYEEQVIRTDDNGQEILNPDGTKPNGNKPQDKGDVANVYFNNTPIRLEVSKVKSAETMITYEINGRLEGSITELKAEYGLENLELAYNASGKYLGYGWKKGFFDSLKQKQAAGESIEILYEDGVFTGKANLYKVPETADDTNRYLPGAVMTLYDAIEVKPNGDSEDYKYDGVNIERDKYGNVKNIYIQKGYAGTAVKYVLDKTDPAGIDEEDYKNYTYNQQEDDKGRGTWTYKTVEREDTDILFYDLGNLGVLTTEKGILYAYDKDGKKMQAKNGEPIFALKNGTAYLEIISGDYENLIYSIKDRLFERVPEGTKIYHLDSDGNRDSQIDPYTGMAFVVEEATGKLLTWPVKISKDQYGNVIAREKIKTSRIAEIESDTKDAYTIGTYDSTQNSLKKSVNPILNKHGQPIYYQKSIELYQKGRAVYDRDGDYVRYKYDDSLKAFNDNAYEINTNDNLKDIGSNPETETDDKPLSHRQGEAYLIENTWTTGEKTQNDPFHTEMTNGQVDVIKRVPAGTYIMEELKAPEGYVKTIPMGLTVDNSIEIQIAKATDNTINGWIEKLDAPPAYSIKVIDHDSILAEAQSSIRIEGKGGFSYQHVTGAELALFRAKRVSTTDLTAHPSGYYLEKTENTPAAWTVLDNQNQAITFTAEWTTVDTPKYLEGIPKGYYILEETKAPAGYIRSSMELEIKEKEGLQAFTLPNDHTKVEIFKYMEEVGKKIPLPNRYAAELALYEAETDADGIVMENGIPKYDKTKETDRWITDDCTSYADFMKEYEKLFDEYETGFARFTFKPGKDLPELTAECISSEETDKTESVRQLFKISDGKQVLIQVTKNLLDTGYYGFVFDYKLNYKELAGNTVSYDTPDGNHRIDYLALNGRDKAGEKKGYYVLVETKTPDGFATAKPKPIVIDETGDIQLYALKNEPKYLHIEKVTEDGKILRGAELALYKAAGDGTLIMDASHLIDKWLSGSEGIYTEEDAANHAIPDGFSVGDLKPHKISPVPYGMYYLVELMAPAGYLNMQPVKLTVTANSDELIKAVNILKKGTVTIEKIDSKNSNKKLSGAKFEVKCQETGDIFFLITDENGTAKSQPIKTGIAGAEGIWKPYHFTIKEITPPDTYQLNLNTYHFQFKEDILKEELSYTISVPNVPTEITISKNDFNDGQLIKGAALAVYRTKAVNGSYEADGDALDSWITDGGKHTIKGRLSAGKVYMLKELKAPAGYNKTAPVIFTISDDGRRIVNVSNHLTIIKFKTSNRYIDAVEAVTVLGRQAAEVKISLTDLDIGKTIDIPSWQTAPLTKRDGLIEGHRYEQKEITCYTDGNERSSSRKIFRLYFSEDGTFTVAPGAADKTTARLETEEGELIEEWTVENRENSGYEHTVYNPEYEDGQSIEVISTNGRHGAGVMPGSIVKYGINYKNSENVTKDIKISVVLDSQTEYMPSNSSPGGRELNGIVTWIIRNAAPGESGSITLSAAVKEDANTKSTRNLISENIITENIVSQDIIRQNQITQNVTIQGENYTCYNPISAEGGLAIVSQLSGTDRDKLKQAEFRYHITLKDSTGNPLKGTFPYSGSQKGSLKSGDTITLKGGEFITLTGMAWGSRYKVELMEKVQLTEKTQMEGLETSTKGEEGITGKQGASAVFLYKKNAPSVREIFKKGGTYHLIETTHYRDGREIISDKLSFTLNENASIGGIDMKDRPTHVTITKTDITGDKEIPGARLILKDEAGNIVDEWISTDKPHELIAVLKPGKTYFLAEISPPSGYAYAETIEFTVSEDGSIDQVRMEDKVTKVEISKTEKGNDKELAGAVLEIQDAAGNTVERFISDGKKHTIKGKLNAGETYYLVEIKAPDGYRLAAPIPFTVSTDGRVDQVTMEDAPTKVVIEKHGLSETGEDTGHLKGAHIQIQDPTGKIVYQFYSDGTQEEITGILKAGETYVAKEIEAPYGYELAAPVTFTPSADDTVITIRMEDKLKPKDPGGKPETPKLSLKKYDGVTFEGLKGAEFTIYKSDGSVYTTVKTGEDGRATITRPPSGTYTVKETKAPEGYISSDKIHVFTVTPGSLKDMSIAVPNWKQPDICIVKEDADTGERLSGAHFAVFDSEGKLCEKGITDANGCFYFLSPKEGQFKIVETKAPKNYELNNSPIYFSVSETGEVTGNLVIQNIRERQKIGFITVEYGKRLSGKGDIRLRFPDSWLWKVPGMGEAEQVDILKKIAFWGLIISLLIDYKRRKGRKH